MTQYLNDFGALLKKARIRLGLSQAEVAQRLGLNSAQSVSDWERNHGSGVPLRTLHRLIKYYQMDEAEVFEALLGYQKEKLEEDLRKSFYGKKSETR